MPSQVLSSEFREAIWITYGQKCFYHTGHIELEDMEIDHVVPESLLGSPDVPAELVRYGLPSTFNIGGRENLVPACRTCNSRKRDNPLPIGQIGIYIAQIAAKLDTLAREIALAEKGVALGYLLRRIANGIDKGRFSREELGAGLMEKGLLPPNVKALVALPETGGSRHTSRPIAFTSHASLRLDQRAILVDEVIEAISRGSAQARKVDGMRPHRYELRTTKGASIVYEVADERIVVITAYYQAGRARI